MGLALFGPGAAASGPGPGCDPGPRAVAHHAGGQVLARQPADRPLPCLTTVGRSSESAMVGVQRSGTLFYAPLNENTDPPPLSDRGPNYVMRSRDQGASWVRLDSGDEPRASETPPWMSVDPDTGRVWLATTLPSLCGTEINWSDDAGSHWQTNPAVGCPGQGSMRLLEGPAPAGAAKPVGYPHVVYMCSNSSDLNPSTLYCYKSLDGGRSFAFVGSFPDPNPPPYACGTEHPARPGAVGPGGLLFFPVDVCGKVEVAVSRDEGASWEHHPVADVDLRDLYTSSVAADDAGNVFMAWIAAPGRSTGGDGCCNEPGLPYLTVSRDRGRSWSKPVMIGAPGVRQALHTALAATGDGHVAVAYLGSRDGGKTYDGYITESESALGANPVFESASVNRPDRPLIDGTHRETFGDRLFVFSSAFGADGVPWAGFHCAYTSSCPGKRMGVVGRLARADAGCLNAPGRTHGVTLGRARLGRRRAAQRRVLGGRLSSRRGGIDRYCVRGGGALRIGYPRRARNGRALLILSSSRDSSAGGLRVGDRSRRLGRRRHVRVGRNTWYLASGRRARLLFKVRAGRIREVGIASKRPTRSERKARRFLRGWRL